MPVVECAGCHKKYKVGHDLAGKRVKCKSCGQVMQVPASDPAPAATPVAKPSASPAHEPPDLDALFAGGGQVDLHFRDDDPVATPPPPPIQHNPGHSTAGGRKLALSASATGTRVPALPATAPPASAPSPIHFATHAPAAIAAPQYVPPQPSYAAPMGALPISHPQHSSVHGQPAVGLDNLSPLLLLLFLVSGVISMIIMTMQLKDAPQRVQEGMPTSAIWTAGFTYFAALFLILGPFGWLATWITSKIFSFQLGDVAYLRSCAVVSIPGSLLFFSPVLQRLDNPIITPLLWILVIPLTYFLMRAVFYMSWGAAAVAFVFNGIFQGIGQFLSFLLVVSLVYGSMVGAAKEKTRLAAEQRMRERDEQTASVTPSVPSIPTRSGSASTPAPPPPPPVIDTIPDEELPVLGAAGEIDPGRLQHHTFLANWMFQPPRETSFAERRGGERPSVTFAAANRSVSTRSGSTIQRPAASIEATAIRTRETAYKTPDGLQKQSKRSRTSTVGAFPCVATYDVEQLYTERQYVTTYHVFTQDYVLEFKVAAFAPFVDPVHKELALCIHTLAPLDATRQALGDLKSTDPKLQAIALERLQSIKPDERKDEIVAVLETLTRDSDRGIKSAAIKAYAQWGDAAMVNALLLTVLGDSDRDTRVAAIQTLASNKDEAAIQPIVALLGRDRDAIDALIAYGDKAEPAVIAYLDRSDASINDQQAGLAVLSKIGTKESIPVLLKLSTSPSESVASGARITINRIQPGTLDDLAIAVLDLKSRSPSKQEAALEKLAQLKVDEKRKGAVGQALLEVALEGFGSRADQAVKLLPQWAGDETAPALIAYLEDETKNHFARQKAIVMLGQLKDPRAINPLIKQMSTGNSTSFDDECQKALIGYGQPLEDEMIKLLNVKKDRVRVNACAVLAEIGTERSIRPLGVMAAHSDFSVSRAGKEALARLKMRLSSGVR